MTERNDRELLELAAKAAGAYWFGLYNCWYMADKPWNPLIDDGDALRLAVKLRMGISIPVWRTGRADVITFKDASVNVVEEGDDLAAITRRAIVRAAAEIGGKM